MNAISKSELAAHNSIGENHRLRAVIQEMIEAGESACFIGQLLKVYFTQSAFSGLHFYEGGMSDEQKKYAFEKACRYAEKL